MTQHTMIEMTKAVSIACVVFVTACFLPQLARADLVEDFYRGKQIVMLVASGAGGGYDTYARAFARHMGAHIPGNPAIVPKNLPAAGGLAAGQVATTALRDIVKAPGWDGARGSGRGRSWRDHSAGDPKRLSQRRHRN